MKHAEGAFETPYSKVHIKWEIKDDLFTICVEQDKNAPLVITLPNGEDYITSSLSVELKCNIDKIE